jgi:hypothetical protein
MTDTRKKYLLHVGVETNLELFQLRNKLERMFLDEIRKHNLRNHVAIRMTQYDKIIDHKISLQGLNNKSGMSFNIINKASPTEWMLDDR